MYAYPSKARSSAVEIPSWLSGAWHWRRGGRFERIDLQIVPAIEALDLVTNVPKAQRRDDARSDHKLCSEINPAPRRYSVVVGRYSD